VWKGASKNVSIGLANDLNLTIPRRHYADLKAEIIVDKKISAPIVEGQKLGIVKVTMKNESIISADLVALQAVEQGNIFQRFYDSIMMMREKSSDKK
jgi:D-alanyl-D-alanine carboxypeptidase (penicillin-binding protein 5/6)